MKKYEFTGETKNWYGIILKNICAIRSFGNVYKGQFGGWIESEKNLSHEGNCWIEENTHVYGNLVVENDTVFSEQIKNYEVKDFYSNPWVYENGKSFRKFDYLFEKYIPLYETHKEHCKFYLNYISDVENNEEIFYDRLKIVGDDVRVDFIWNLIKNRNEPHIMFIYNN